MKKTFLSLMALIMCAGLVTAGDAKTYGEGVTLAKAVAIEALLANPEDYAGQKVRVDGVVTGVCKTRGCWMQVSDPDTGNSIKVKVEDGVIVFPYTAMGHEASAEGVFEILQPEPENQPAVATEAKPAAAGHDCPHAKAAAKAATGGCDKEKAAAKAAASGCDKDNAAAKTAASGCDKDKAAAAAAEGGCGSHESTPVQVQIRGTGAVITA